MGWLGEHRPQSKPPNHLLATYIVLVMVVKGKPPQPGRQERGKGHRGRDDTARARTRLNDAPICCSKGAAVEKK